MKKIKLLLAGLILIAGAHCFAQEMNLCEILDAHFEAIGQEKILELESIIIKGTARQMDMEFPYKIIQKRPDNFYMEAEIQGAKLQQGYDGENGWMVAPWTGSLVPNDITGPELRGMKEQADMDGYLWNWEEKGCQAELVGTEDMEGSEVYNIKLTKEEGDVSNYYIDMDYFVILKIKSKLTVQGSEIEQETLLSNYKPVNGMLLPHSTEQRMNNGQTMMTIAVDTVLFDAEIEDTIFAKPVVPESE